AAEDEDSAGNDKDQSRAEDASDRQQQRREVSFYNETSLETTEVSTEGLTLFLESNDLRTETVLVPHRTIVLVKVGLSARHKREEMSVRETFVCAQKHRSFA